MSSGFAILSSKNFANRNVQSDQLPESYLISNHTLERTEEKVKRQWMQLQVVTGKLTNHNGCNTVCLDAITEGQNNSYAGRAQNPRAPEPSWARSGASPACAWGPLSRAHSARKRWTQPGSSRGGAWATPVSSPSLRTCAQPP
jgi:hypothetical protein